MTTYTYDKAKRALALALEDMRILAGDRTTPCDASWQDVAGTAAVNLRALASLLDAARWHGGTPVFPSPDDLDGAK